MFSFISWSQYITCLIITTLLYYLVTWIVLFKGRLPVLNGENSIRSFSLHEEDSPDEMLTTAQHVMDELRPLIQRGASQQQLMYALRQRLQKYASWEEEGFRDTVNRFVCEALYNTCSIRLGEEDQRALWK